MTTTKRTSLGFLLCQSEVDIKSLQSASIGGIVVKISNPSLAQAPLGKKSAYVDSYQPDLLFPIPRQAKRQEIGIDESALPFVGVDIWTGFELSWLNQKGKPQIAMAIFSIPCQSANIIESKSFKLYLNSFNNTKFDGWQQVTDCLTEDLSKACGMAVVVRLYDEKQALQLHQVGQFEGQCIDELDIECNIYQVEPAILKVDANSKIDEKIYSNLLKSNCLVTGQPDWGSIVIEYRGAAICHQSLLQYLVSFRNHNEFHEQCVERIFKDIMDMASPEVLSVYARYTRRGGLDINPFRSTHLTTPPMNVRLFRQ